MKCPVPCACCDDEGMSKASVAMEDLESRAQKLGVIIGATFEENGRTNG